MVGCVGLFIWNMDNKSPVLIFLDELQTILCFQKETSCSDCWKNFHHLLSLSKVMFPVIVKMNFSYAETQPMKQMKAQCQRLAVLSQKVVMLMIFFLLTQILISCLVLQVQLKVKICSHSSCFCYFHFIHTS